MQYLDTFAEDLAKLPKNDALEDTIKDYHKKIIDFLKKVPVNDRRRTRQLGYVASTISKRYRSKSDPDIADLISDVCEKASSEYLKYVQEESNPTSLKGEIMKTAKRFSDCVRPSSAPNLELLKTYDTVNMSSTPFPLVDIAIITEEYADYVDDQNTSKILKKYEDASNRMVRICYSNAKALAIFISAIDKTRTTGDDTFRITATKRLGSKISNRTISSQNVNVKASEDFSRYENEEVTVLLCTCKRNPFWWMLGENITTPVSMITFLVGDQIVQQYEKPFLISFKNYQTNFSWIPVHETTTPRQPDASITDGYDFEKMSMFRIDVYAQQGYIVEFLDLSANDILDVSVTDFVKPTTDEFREEITNIEFGNITHLFISYELDFDSWHYLSILPNEKMGNQKVQVTFRVYTPTCVSWKAEERIWEFSCGAAAASSLTSFHCLCYHSSVLAGRISANYVREERTINLQEQYLELQTTLIIFASVAVAFSMYCVLLTIIAVSSDQDYERRIYFLGDVPTAYRYGYLLITKTGNVFNAGTTSNVVIRLYGNKSESKAHVLNSPDPHRIILQQNQEDWFFLATRRYLGEIRKLKIWFDCSGLKPSWHCSEIEVVDLQKNKYWRFNIKFRFDISNKVAHVHTAVPEKPHGGVKSRKFHLKRFSFQGSHMWNIFRQEGVTFSRLKRLTIMLSIFMTTYTSILFLYGFPELRYSDRLDFFMDYSFHLQLIWATIGGLAITIFLHLPIAHFSRFPFQGRRSGIFVYISSETICWCFLGLFVIVSMTSLLILGFWVPHITVLLWLTSAIASLLLYIFLIENVVRLIYNTTLKRTRRMAQIIRQVKHVLPYIEIQRMFLLKKFGPVSLRPNYEHLYRPLSRSKERKYWAQTRADLLEIVQDLVMISLYVVLLYTLILIDKDPVMRMSHQEVLDLIQGNHSRTMKPKNVITYEGEVDNYITDTLIFSMQSLQWYERFLIKDPGMTIDNNNKYIGIARLRQHRSNNYSCIVAPQMRFLTRNCVPSYSDGPELGEFSEGWDTDGESDEFARMDSVWNYKNPQITGTYSYLGKFARYPGGGYVATLGRNWKNSLINMQYIKRNNWIDRFTRWLSIEFLMYSPNSNLFQSIRVEFEMSTTGFVRTSYKVHTARLLFVKDKSSLFLQVVMTSFLLIVFVMFVRLLHRMITKKELVFKDPWILADTIIISMSISCSYLYIERSFLVKNFLDKIEKAKHNEFINYFHLFSAETTLTILAAALVFIATLRLWKLLRFLLIIRIVEKTLKLSMSPLFYMFIFHELFVFLFQLIGITVFSDLSFGFEDGLASMMTLILLGLGFRNYYDLQAVKAPLQQLFYSLYMTASLFFLTLYVAMITTFYAEAQIYYSNQEEYDVFDYVYEQFQYYKGVVTMKIKRSRHRGGQDHAKQKLVFAKADKHRYAKCLTMTKNKANSMLYITRGVLRNMRFEHEFTVDEENLMKMIIANMFRNNTQEEDYFFVGNLASDKAMLVDDLVLQKMEKFLNIALIRKDEEKGGIGKELLGISSKKIEKIENELSILSNMIDELEFDVDE
ncbi:hypothetical protein JTB14_024223 [Gonioctena quinquepunctata]|nr:hypothetical protein JTB14_024223 [Gonioctena quinquepunctata]